SWPRQGSSERVATVRGGRRYTGSTTPASTIGAVHPTLDSRTTAPRLCSREALQVAMAYPTKPAQVGPDRTTASAGLGERVRGSIVRGPLRSPATRVWLFTALVASLALCGYLLDVRYLAPVESPVHIPWPVLAFACLLAETKVILVHFRRETHSFS